MMWSECDADKVIIRGEHTLSSVFDKHLKIMHEILDDTVEFRKTHNFNDFSYNFGAYLNELYILNKQLLSVIEKYKQVDNQIIQHGGSGGKF